MMRNQPLSWPERDGHAHAPGGRPSRSRGIGPARDPDRGWDHERHSSGRVSGRYLCRRDRCHNYRCAATADAACLMRSATGAGCDT